MAIGALVLCAAIILCLSSTIHCMSLGAGDLDEFYKDDLTITTSTGIVRGGYGGVTRGNKNIFRFRSIPYAEPPLNNLRFEPPVPKTPWNGILDVRDKKPVCTQGSDPVIGSEDCLFLKIYMTSLPKEQKKLPVMVWIYGGAFTSGYANFSDNSVDLLLDEYVMMVSFQYRVGLFGFLSTGDLVAPGNAGIKDQVLALKWIKENIANFGGDPDRITLFGQSAGASSIGYILQTNATRGLFNGVIMHSGNSLCQWALTRNAPTFAKDVASALKIATSSSQVMIKGLKTANSTLLQQTSASKSSSALMSNNPLGGLAIGPVVEPDHQGAIITGESDEKLRNGQFHYVPIIIGHTSTEALIESLSSAIRIWLLSFDLQPSRLVPTSMNSKGVSTNNRIGRFIRSHYFSSTVAGSNSELMKFVSDDQWQRPIQESVRLYSARTPVFYYEFSHIGSLYGINDRTVQGVGHTEDLGYIFDFGHAGSDADNLVRSRMVTMWTNFAKTGSATPIADPLLENTIWTPNTRQSADIIRLDISSNLSLTVNPSAVDMNFWHELFDTRGNRPFSTY